MQMTFWIFYLESQTLNFISLLYHLRILGVILKKPSTQLLIKTHTPKMCTNNGPHLPPPVRPQEIMHSRCRTPTNQP